MRVNSRVVLILFRLPAVPEVIDVSSHSAIWFGEIIVWVPVVVTTETTHLVIVRAGWTKTIEDYEMTRNV